MQNQTPAPPPPDLDPTEVRCGCGDLASQHNTVGCQAYAGFGHSCRCHKSQAAVLLAESKRLARAAAEAVTA